MGERILVDTDCLIDYYKGGLELNPEAQKYKEVIDLHGFQFSFEILLWLFYIVGTTVYFLSILL